MQQDLSLVIGLVAGVFAVTGLVAAYAEQRTPRAAGLVLAVAGGLILYAVATRPGGYQPAEIAQAFFRVIARLLG